MSDQQFVFFVLAWAFKLIGGAIGIIFGLWISVLLAIEAFKVLIWVLFVPLWCGCYLWNAGKWVVQKFKS